MKAPAAIFFENKLRKIGDAQGNTEKRIFQRPDITQKIQYGEIRKVHLTGVCGKAMSSLAGLFVEAGFVVSGSDVGCYPPASDMIEELGIVFYEGYSEEHVKDKDLVIIANMFGPDNAEAKYVRENNIPSMSMSEAIREFFIKDKESIVITGTHGKTTTTGLAAHVFMAAKRNPGFVVGGVAVPTVNGITETSFSAGPDKKGDTSQGQKGFFIIEGDEYDTAYFDKAPKFLHYKPTIAVVTSLEFDHADIYSDFNEYKKSFVFLAEEVSNDGHLVLNGDSDEVTSLAPHTSAHVAYYGLKDINDFVAKDITVTEEGQSFTVLYKGQDLGRYSICLFGAYNVMNALAVFAASYLSGLSLDEIRAGLETFKGMKRRQEIIGKPKGVILIDDFAHHPTAVRETLQGIREHFPKNKLIAVFEPRSNTSRKKMFEDDYAHAFQSADELYLSMPALREMDNPADFIDGTVIVETAIKVSKNKDFRAFCVRNCDEVLEQLVPTLKEGDVVVMMSNGSFDGIYEKILNKLSA
ncbi:MAG: UDP-N-acetylmuramate:L-alanyl-gamma-D-glutamyl-meso-diaminopimelate ligase [Candidatus Taylorbacteria bacterium]|nr:UDP-N-acetylmuramate:L-alanyl-gamma-D-glutamyl-meso-diaminopimelate ligase [Candidatus Taylorbacteria bacterium]